MKTVLLIGDTIRELRMLRGLTQREVAEATGLKRMTISQIESDYRGVSTPTLAKLAHAFCVPPSYIHLLSDRTDDDVVRRLQRIVRRSLKHSGK